MDNRVSYSSYGIFLNLDNKKILLDPNRLVESDLVFVSHAHTDHLYRNSRKKINVMTLASKETVLIAKERGYHIEEHIEEHNNFKLINTGHIIGSRGLLIDNELYYTGDISTRPRGFMKPSINYPKVDTLIIESTFGAPQYIFPPISKVIHETNKIISDCYEKGIPVIIMGYSLGKAQLLIDLFKHWDPIYIHDSIFPINNIYRKLGIKLREDLEKFSEAEKGKKLSKNKPWILFAPLMNGKSKFLISVKEKYNPVTIGFSGWSINKKYKFMMNLDYAFPISDHCDYNELIQVVKRCNPRKVFTFHGFAEEFSLDLNTLGYNAEPIIKDTKLKKREKTSIINKQKKIENFF